MSPDFFEWIEKHISDDPSRLRLKYGRQRAGEILQIEMRRKHISKFGDILKDNPRFIFPNSLSAEQSTSWRLAEFHASLIGEGTTIADLTAGLGMDTMAFARKAAKVVAVERNEEVADALRHNSNESGNIEIITCDCREKVKEWAKSDVHFDVVFIDPARRDASGGRIFRLSESEPDVIAMFDDLREITGKIIVKASPMLDISSTVAELNAVGAGVCQVIALSTPTECKELDLECEPRRNTEPPVIRAVTIGAEVFSDLEFTRKEEENATANYGIPAVGDYIFDPYPSIMKAGAFKLLGERYGLSKLGSNTHLWFSNEPETDFPGAVFKVVEIVPYMSKHIKRYSSRFPRVGVTTRNFDISSDTLRAKLKVAEGPLRLFAVTAYNGQKLLITCEKI